MRRFITSSLIAVLVALVFVAPAVAAKVQPKSAPKAAPKAPPKGALVKLAVKPTARAKSPGTKSKIAARSVAPRKKLRPASRRRGNPYRQSWSEPSYADSTMGDRIDGEDLLVRRAAVEALGPLNGSVIVTDPQTGRVLTIVNQKLALKSGFTPCSTIKLVTAMAGLVEGVMEPSSYLPGAGRRRMALTQALATSDNPYFARVGNLLGFERVIYYSRLFGLGEKAGLDIEGEQAGELPEEPPPGGTGMITYYGMGVKLTPLQLAALLSMIANGGTLHYLQYPQNPAEAELLIPKVKRQMELANVVRELKPGMAGAVEYGTARRAFYDENEPILGKTGTCTHSDQRTHLGWFGSYNQVGDRKLVVVVLLTGGRPINGPVASGVGGQVYKILSGQHFFASTGASTTNLAEPEALVTR